MPTLLNRTIRLFLDSIGRREEYEFYLQKFASLQTPAFAILCPERAGFEEVASVFTFDLDFLIKLELHPAILLAGAEATEMRDILFTGEHPYADYEMTPVRDSQKRVWGDAREEVDFLSDCRRMGKVGVLLALHDTLHDALLHLVPEAAKRVHIIRPRGPLRDVGGEVLNYYYTARASQAVLAEEDVPVAEMAARVIESRPGTHISVSSPWNLLRELFTVKGAGCVIRRGSTIRRLTDMTQVDKTRLVHLLERSFGRKIANVEFLARLAEVYVEEEYRGAALLEAHGGGTYLSKFSVGTEARGEGLANELWEEMSRDHARLFWRTRVGNPINHWYEKRADGYQKTERWVVFWKGVGVPDIPEVIEYALTRPDDFTTLNSQRSTHNSQPGAVTS